MSRDKQDRVFSDQHSQRFFDLPGLDILRPRSRCQQAGDRNSFHHKHLKEALHRFFREVVDFGWREMRKTPADMPDRALSMSANCAKIQTSCACCGAHVLADAKHMEDSKESPQCGVLRKCCGVMKGAVGTQGSAISALLRQ